MKCILCGKESDKLINDVCPKCIKDYNFTPEQVPGLARANKNNTRPIPVSKTANVSPSRTQVTKESGFQPNIWIQGLKLMAFIVFVTIFIAGFYIGNPFIQMKDYKAGFLIIGGGFVLAFLSIAFLMVILNMAQDISEINHKLK